MISVQTKFASDAELSLIEEWIRSEYALRTHAITVANVPNVDWCSPEYRIQLVELQAKAQACGIPADKFQLEALMSQMARGLLRKGRKKPEDRLKSAEAVLTNRATTVNVESTIKQLQQIVAVAKRAYDEAKDAADQKQREAEWAQQARIDAAQALANARAALEAALVVDEA